MSISLPALLKLASFPQQEIEKLKDNIDYVTEDEKLKLSSSAWYFISQKYFMMLELERVRILDEVKKGIRKYNPNDFEEVKAKLISELVQKLQTTKTQESIQEVRQQLEKYKSKPLVSDHSSPTPPVQKS